MSEPSPQAVAWMRQWQAAGPALEAVRRLELRALTEEEALAASEALLSMAALTPAPKDRLTSSGLVIQQALLHRRRPR